MAEKSLQAPSAGNSGVAPLKHDIAAISGAAMAPLKHDVAATTEAVFAPLKHDIAATVGRLEQQRHEARIRLLVAGARRSRRPALGRVGRRRERRTGRRTATRPLERAARAPDRPRPRPSDLADARRA